MVHPHPGRVADGDAVSVLDEADLQVLDNDVGYIRHVKAAAGDMSGPANADDGLVGADLGAGWELDLALDPDHLGLVASNSSAELRGVVDGHGGATLAARGCADRVVFGKALDIPGGKAKAPEGARCGQWGQGGEDRDEIVEPHGDGPGSWDGVMSCRWKCDTNKGCY